MSSSAATNTAPCDIERLLKPNIANATDQFVGPATENSSRLSTSNECALSEI